jgi:hypothetical protein
MLCYVEKCVALASYKKAKAISFISSTFPHHCGGPLLKSFTPLGLSIFLSHALCLEWISCGWFVDFGWIFMQLGLDSLGFLDTINNCL